MSGNELDRFMMACSDLKQPAKSRLFQARPGLKDIKVQPRPTQTASFQTSQKARDWSVLDLGDAFRQPSLPAQQLAMFDDDDFDDFQSCPPPAAAAAATPSLPLAGLATPLSSVPGLQSSRPPGTTGGVPFFPVNGTTGGGGGGRLDLGPPYTPAAVGPFSPPPPAGGPAGFAADLLNGLSLGSAERPGVPPAPLSGQAPLLNGSASLSGGWGGPAPAEPAATVGYTPVQTLQPAAKPTRFREGLVQRPAEPDDEFAEFVAAAPAPAPASRRPGAAPEPASGRVRTLPPGRLPTVDNSPPRAASPPAGDVYAALRDLSAPLPDPAAPPAAAPRDSAPSAASCDLLSAFGPTELPGALPPALSEFPGPLAPAPCRPPAGPAAPPPPPLVSGSAEEDEDFGEFVSSSAGPSLLAAGADEPCEALGAGSRQGSLPSLDLQVAAPASDGGEVSPLEPERRDAAAADKYDSFRQEIMSASCSEPALVSEWRRCLQACYDLLQEGVALFGSVSSSQTCQEVARSRRGAAYIDNLSQVFRVVGRIQSACQRYGCRHQLDLILSETCKVWANLTAFVANSPTRPSADLEWSAPDDCGADGGPLCGVCLLPTSDGEPALACAGRSYHAGCANLWINRVSGVLPGLQP